MEYTPAVERLLKFAEIEAEKSGNKFVGVNHILVGMMLDGNNFGALALREAGFEVTKLRNHQTPTK